MPDIGEALLQTTELYGGTKSYRALLRDYRRLLDFARLSERKSVNRTTERDWSEVSRRILFTTFLAVSALIVGVKRAGKIAARTPKVKERKISDFLLELCRDPSEIQSARRDNIRSAIGRLASAVVQSNAARVSRDWRSVEWWSGVIPSLILNLEQQIGRKIDISELLVSDTTADLKFRPKRGAETKTLLLAGPKPSQKPALALPEKASEAPGEHAAHILIIPPALRRVEIKAPPAIKKPAPAVSEKPIAVPRPPAAKKIRKPKPAPEPKRAPALVTERRREKSSRPKEEVKPPKAERPAPKKTAKPAPQPKLKPAPVSDEPKGSVVAFGVFDGIHEGHKYFLQEAKKLGDHLTVVVASDGVVERLKNKIPRYNVKERVVALKNSGLADAVREGDETLGNWNIVSKVKPDIIAVGYDQEELEFEAAAFIIESGLDIKLRKIPAFKPERYKSSVINMSPKP